MRRRNFIKSIALFSIFKKEAIEILSKIEIKKEINYSNFALPLIRSLNYGELASKLISVQPLHLPKEKIYYLDYTYEKKTQC